MKKIMILIILLSVLLTSQVLAQEHDFEDIKSLMDSGASCSQLTNEQLEEIGDYYMEQMHPGEAHEIVDNMMGGEGSESLKQVHINMARRLYCNENVYIGYGMMGYGGLIGIMNRVGGSMMGNYQPYYSYNNYGYWNLLWIVFLVAIIIIIALMIYKFRVKKVFSSGTPLNILKKRFARGEITKKQFDDIKRDLEE